MSNRVQSQSPGQGPDLADTPSGPDSSQGILSWYPACPDQMLAPAPAFCLRGWVSPKRVSFPEQRLLTSVFESPSGQHKTGGLKSAKPSKGPRLTSLPTRLFDA